MQSEPRKRPRTELSDNVQVNLNETEILQIKMIEELLLNQGFSDYDDEFEELDSQEMIKVEQEATQKYFEQSMGKRMEVIENVQNDEVTEILDRDSDVGDQGDISSRMDLIPSPQTQAQTQAHTESLFSLKQKLALAKQKETELEKSLFDKVGECEFARSKINQLQVDNDRLKKSVQNIEREAYKASAESKKSLEESVANLKTQITFKDHEINTLQAYINSNLGSQTQPNTAPLSRPAAPAGRLHRNPVHRKSPKVIPREQVPSPPPTIVTITKNEASTSTDQPEINPRRDPYTILLDLLTDLEVSPTNLVKHNELLKLARRGASFQLLIDSIFPYRDKEYLLQMFGFIIVSGIPQDVGSIFNLDIFPFLVAEYSYGLLNRNLNLYLSRWILDISLECPSSSRVSLAFIANTELILFFNHASTNPSIPHEPILNLIQSISILLSDEFLSTRLKAPELFESLSQFLPDHHPLIQIAIIGIYFSLDPNEISTQILRKLITSFHQTTKSSMIEIDITTRYLINNYIDILYEMFTARNEDVKLDLGLYAFMVVSLKRCINYGFVDKGLLTKCKQLLDLFL